MGFLSRLKKYAAETIDWVRNKPAQVAVWSLIVLLAGIGAGLIFAPVSVGMGAACSISMVIGAAIKLNNDGIKMHQDEAFRAAQIELVKENAENTLELAKERAAQALKDTALIKNAQTISDKDAEIAKLKNELLQAKAQNIHLVPPISTVPSAAPSQEDSKVSIESMFKNPEIKRRTNRNAAVDSQPPAAYETESDFSAKYQ